MRVTWIGHASAVVEAADQRVLIDPLGRSRCRAAGDVDAILITHSHVDHLNRWTLKAMNQSARLIVPRGAKAIVENLGFSSVTEAEPGDQIAIGSLEITAVPTHHDSGRWRRGDNPICLGYLIAQDGLVVHHAGDIDMSTFAVFDDIGRDHRIDATLLPIGGMLPVWYYRWRRRSLDNGIHIDPDTALGVAQRLGAKTMVPIHWGTVHLPFGLPSAPRQRLHKIATATGQDDLVSTLSHGETFDLKDRSET